MARRNRDFTRGFYIGQEITKERKYGKNPNVYSPITALAEAKKEKSRLKGSRRTSFIKGLTQGIRYWQVPK